MGSVMVSGGIFFLGNLAVLTPGSISPPISGVKTWTASSSLWNSAVVSAGLACSEILSSNTIFDVDIVNRYQVPHSLVVKFRVAAY